MPASSARCRSADMACAVMAIIGVCFPVPSAMRTAAAVASVAGHHRHLQIHEQKRVGLVLHRLERHSAPLVVMSAR